MRDLRAVVPCRTCDTVQEIEVDSADYMRWEGGEYAQTAFPYLDADQREMLISQTCAGCWVEMFRGDDD